MNANLKTAQGWGGLSPWHWRPAAQMLEEL